MEKMPAVSMNAPLIIPTWAGPAPREAAYSGSTEYGDRSRKR